MNATLRRLKAPIDHRWAEPRLSAYVEDELPARQRRRLHEHQGICPECRKAIRQLRGLLRSLPGLRERGAASVAERTAAAVMREIERDEGKPA